MHRIQIQSQENNPRPVVLIDNQKIRTRSIAFHADSERIPTVIVEFPSVIDIEINHADLQFKYVPKSVIEAVKILSHEFLVDKDLYNGFIASIASVLEEFQTKQEFLDDGYNSFYLAEMILNRVLGNE